MEYLKIWCNFAEILEPLNDSERGRLFTAMLEYASTGKLPDFKGNERYVWPIAKQAIDRARAESEKQAANGAKGGRPKNQTKPTETQQNPTEPTETLKNKEKEKIKEDIKENPLKGVKEKTAARFTAPTVEKVAEYCRERGNGVDPQRFIDFYTAKGWKIGQNPMKDWKAAVRTWEQRDGNQGKAKTVSAQQYQQRNYTEDELLSVSDDILAQARAARSSA